MSYHRPTYGGMRIDTTPAHLADSVSLAGGNIVSGAVADTQTINQTYLRVEEDDGVGGAERFDIQFVFSGLGGNPSRCNIIGRYDGNPAHNVFLYIWNYDTTTWDRVTSAGEDFDDSATDASFTFDITSSVNYVSGGESKLRIYHDSVPVSANEFYLDFIELEHATAVFTNAGDVVQLTGFTASVTDQVTVNGSAGTITIVTAGDYEFSNSISFSGTPDAVFDLELYVDGASVATMWERRMGTRGDVGSAGSIVIRTFAAGEVITVRMTSDTDASYASIITMRTRVFKLN